MEQKKNYRCAIYTRKSSENGMEQDFNSLDAQRESGENYIKSQKSEGWSVVKKQYNDGGFSGGNMDRPALKALLNDIKNRLIDVVVVYKVDRLSRSLHDFAKLIEQFDEYGVTFVSVTQSFNTKDSMGRLTLNMLLSFAQFEREVTSERIRDKIEASKKKGMWMGGTPPLGYDIKDRHLIINEDEAKQVRYIFEGYLKAKSIIHFIEHLREKGITNKRWTTEKGHQRGGSYFDRAYLSKLLNNPLLLGKTHHKGKLYDGLHEAIIDQEMWDSVQAKLAKNNTKKESNHHRSQILLKGMVFDVEGRAYSPGYSGKKLKDGTRCYHHYYISQVAIKEGSQKADVPRVPQIDLEAIVLDQLHKHIQDEEQKILLKNWDDKTYLDKRASLKRLIEKVVIFTDKIRIVIKTAQGPLKEHEVPARFRKYGGKKLILDENGKDLKPTTTKKDPSLIKALIRAHKWDRMLKSGEAASFKEIADSENMRRGYVRQIYNLIFLAPEIQTAILEGRQPDTLILARMMLGNIPLSWSEQKEVFGF